MCALEIHPIHSAGLDDVGEEDEGAAKKSRGQWTERERWRVSMLNSDEEKKQKSKLRNINECLERTGWPF